MNNINEALILDFKVWLEGNFPEYFKKEGKHVLEIAREIIKDTSEFRLRWLEQKVHTLEFPSE